MLIIIDNGRLQNEKKFLPSIMVIGEQNKIPVIVTAVSKKDFGHLYWLLVTEIKFPSSIMVIRNQNKIPVIDNDYR